MVLPIDVIPGSKPRRFRWRSVTDAFGGPRVTQHEGTLMPTMESAVAELIELAKRQAADIEALKKQVQNHETVPNTKRKRSGRDAG